MEEGKKLTRKEITALLQEKLSATGVAVSKDKAGDVLDCVTDVIVDALLGGHTVGLTGFGTFTVKEDAARVGVKPGTSEKIQIPAMKRMKFKVADKLADRVKAL